MTNYGDYWDEPKQVNYQRQKQKKEKKTKRLFFLFLN